MLRSLGNPRASSGLANLVLFDNLTEIPYRRGWASGRTASTHLSRVEDVVRFYAGKLGKPIWLMGHSAGSISITETYKRLQAKNQESLIAGLIYSAGVVGTSFNDKSTLLPVLVMHHENDECVSTTPAHAAKIHAGLKEAGNQEAEFALIKTGQRDPGGRDACISGFHMYQGASAEVAQVIAIPGPAPQPALTGAVNRFAGRRYKGIHRKVQSQQRRHRRCLHN